MAVPEPAVGELVVTSVGAILHTAGVPRPGAGTVVTRPAVFRIEDGTLRDNIITQGKNPSEKVTRVMTFTGQAFQLPEEADPILVFNNKYKNYQLVNMVKECNKCRI